MFSSTTRDTKAGFVGEVQDVPSTDFGIFPIPKRLRYDPDKPFHFGFVLNASFGFASTFIIANLIYCQPLLIQFSIFFHVSYSEISTIPTLIQAGYAAGLFLLCPLGDLVRRRQLILSLVFVSTTLTIGLAITPSLRVFEALCFLIGAASVVPPILMPLAADLAPPERRTSTLSVVLAGLMLGILIARVLAGVIAEFTTWRVVYYVAIGVQCLVFVGAYLLLPDYPPKNRDLTYFKILYTMTKYAVTEPLVVQASLVIMTSMASFTSFWVTLTFLLGGPPYHYSTIDIGLFGFVGIFGVLVGPIAGWLAGNLVPWYATLVATLGLLVSQAVQTTAGGINVSAVVIACFGIDVFRQMQQVSLTVAVLGISDEARSRLNAILIISLFVGQVMGTVAGTQVFVQYGWRACSYLMLVLYAFQLVVLALRGPHCPRNHWFGWAGGYEPRKCAVNALKRNDASKTTMLIDEPQSSEQIEEGMRSMESDNHFKAA